MNHTPTTVEAVFPVEAVTPVTPDRLAGVTGGGIASQLGSMFGAEGARWGGVADHITGMFGGAAAG